MPLTSAVAAARENALPFQLVQGVVAVCVGREERFFLEGPFTQVQMPFQHKIRAPGMRDARRRWSLLLGQTWEEQLR